MERLLAILGWIVYGGVVLYAFSALLFIFRAVRTGGTITQMGLFQWALAGACAVAFGAADWNKLHLLWVVPVGILASFTPLGRSDIWWVSSRPWCSARRADSEAG